MQALTASQYETTSGGRFPLPPKAIEKLTKYIKQQLQASKAPDIKRTLSPEKDGMHDNSPLTVLREFLSRGARKRGPGRAGQALRVIETELRVWEDQGD